MNRFVLVTSLSLIVVFELAAAADLKQAASDACQCLETPYAQVSVAMKTAKQAKKSGDVAKLVESRKRIIEVIEESASCFEALSTKYPDIDQSDDLKQQVVTLTQQMCPNPAIGG